MRQYKIINNTMDKFEEVALIAHNLRLHTKAYEKEPTVYRRQKQKVEMVYWQARMDKWLEENTEKVN